jgi:hypothetical protein
MIRLIRKLWSSASAPAAFFGRRIDDDPRPLRALGVAMLSWAAGASVAGWALATLTDSDPLILIAATVGASLPYLVLVWSLGGLAIVRPARLDLRAWEISGWSWAPAGFLGAALVPVVPFAPLAALAVGMIMLPAWNIFVLYGGLRVFAPAPRIRPASLIYLTVVWVAPLVFTVLTFYLVQLGLGVSTG